MKKNLLKILTSQAFIIFFIATILNECANNESYSKKEIAKPITGSQAIQYKKPPSGFNDTLVINSVSAVYYTPDSLQLSKIKAITKRELYETDVHNCFYLMRNAQIVLKTYSPHINFIETSKVRYLLFIKANKSQTCIDLNTKEDVCGIFLFDRKKEPELIDMMNINTALDFYFKK